MMNRAYLVFSLHDPELQIYPFIKKITPILKENFDGVFMGTTPSTEIKFKKSIEPRIDKNFFYINYNREHSLIGDHHILVYKNAVKQTRPQDTLHLCTPDRIVYSIIKYRNLFLTDMMEAKKHELPTLFIRSEKAWQTHPTNYHAIESMVTRLGEILFGQSIDFAWCHLSLRTNYLKKIIDRIISHNLTVYAEIVYYLKDKLTVKTVDWLSWEDPFILGVDPKNYKNDRESDSKESEKRLTYVLPMINFLLTKK